MFYSADMFLWGAIDHYFYILMVIDLVCIVCILITDAFLNRVSGLDEEARQLLHPELVCKDALPLMFQVMSWGCLFVLILFFMMRLKKGDA